MAFTIYYYKRADGTWVFYDSIKKTIVLDERRGAKYHLSMRKTGYNLWRLYLDIPVDFNFIRSRFFDPAYWNGRTWQQEDQA